MDILSIPFHKYLNIKRSGISNYIFEIEVRPEYHNHLGTIHACVQLSLAEASSGEFLLQEFRDLKDVLIPVVRRSEAKYNKPAKGNLYTKAKFLHSSRKEIYDNLINKNRALVQVLVTVVDEEENKIATVIFDWFIKKVSI